ncbi:MAG: hypothetical protein D6814_05925 [Calditrichaeota bacterium]|nr:MAG: hypothetical protein D6814_05925 [Calditrichota bacterium]
MAKHFKINHLFPTECFDEELQEALKSNLRQRLFYICMGLAMWYAIFASAYFWLQTPAIPVPMLYLSLVSALILTVVGCIIKRLPTSTRWLETLGAAVYSIFLFNTFVILTLTKNPIHSTLLMILAIGTGLFFSSGFYIKILLAAATGGWIVIAAFLARRNMLPWVQYGFVLIILDFLSLLIYRTRLKAYRDINKLLLKNKRKQEQLKKAFLVAKEVQQRYRRLSEATFEGIIVHRNGKIVDVNQSMALVPENLYRSEDLANVNFAEYARKLVMNIHRSYVHPPGRIQLDFQLDPVLLGVDLAIPAGLILNELVSNAVKHAFAERDSGKISITFRQRDVQYELRVVDNGHGLPPGFDLDTCESLGLQLVSALAEQIQGQISYSCNGGTQFIVRFNIPRTPVPPAILAGD